VRVLACVLALAACSSSKAHEPQAKPAPDARRATPEDMAKVAVAPQHLVMTGKKMALGEIAETFHDRHRLTYGHDNRSEPVQLVSARVVADPTSPSAASPARSWKRLTARSVARP